MDRRRYLILTSLMIVAALGVYGYLSIERYGLENLVSLISIYGVAAIVFAESGLLIGFFLPGDSMLFTVGFLIFEGVINFNIHTAALIFFAAAALGDSVGYTFGRRVGRRLFNRKDSLLFNKKNLQHAEDFYKKHGGKTIIIARFVPVVRTFAPIVAGVSHMNYRRFLAFNIVGALIWAVGATYLGYYAGTWIDRYNINIEYVILGIIVVTFIPIFYEVLKDKQRRLALLQAAKTALSALLPNHEKQ